MKDTRIEMLADNMKLRFSGLVEDLLEWGISTCELRSRITEILWKLAACTKYRPIPASAPPSTGETNRTPSRAPRRAEAVCVTLPEVAKNLAAHNKPLGPLTLTQPSAPKQKLRLRTTEASQAKTAEKSVEKPKEAPAVEIPEDVDFKDLVPGKDGALIRALMERNAAEAASVTDRKAEIGKDADEEGMKEITLETNNRNNVQVEDAAPSFLFLSHPVLQNQSWTQVKKSGG